MSGREQLRGSSALVLVALLIASVVAPAALAAAPAAAAQADAQNPPSGMVAIASSNIEDVRPSGVPRNVTTSDLDGAVYVSEHASTTSVDLVTGEQAEAVASGASPSEVAYSTACKTPAGANSAAFSCDTRMALVVSDDVHHDGRRVAIDTEVVREAVGYIPSEITVANNESGQTWTSAADVRDGWLVADVEHFSSNSVSFEGTVEVNATPATESTSVSYNLSDVDSVSAPVVNLTGVTNTEWDNVSAADVTNGDSIALDVAGSVSPTGPASGEPRVKFTGAASDYNMVSDEGDGATDSSRAAFGDDCCDSAAKVSMEFSPDSNTTMDSVIVPVGSVQGSDYGFTVEVRVASGGADSTYGEGTVVQSSWDPTFSSNTEQTINFGTSIDVTAGNTYEIEFITSSSDGDATEDSLDFKYDNSAGSTRLHHFKNGGVSWWGDLIIPDAGSGPSDPSIDVDGDGSAEASYSGTLGIGETYSEAVNLSLSDDTATVSLSSGVVDTSVEFKERTPTSDVGIGLNTKDGGGWMNQSGTLADGETVSLEGNSSWLQNGENTLDVSLPSLSADAPEPKVNMAYSHDAKKTQTVEYSAESLTVRYSVGENFSSDQSDVQMRIPFAKTVYSMRDVEEQRNGNGWSDVSSTDYRITDSNELVVDVGSVSKGDVVEVRANGSRVRTNNMSITVVEPTSSGDLDSKIRIDSIGSDASLGVVASTDSPEFLRYTSKESWSDATPYVRAFENGHQRLYLPNAASGDTFRLNSHGTKVIPETNEVDVLVEDSAVEPVLRVRPGPTEGDPVSFKYYNTVSGETYSLYSETHGLQRDSAEANSPVLLDDDDSLETLSIFETSSSTSSTDGSSSDSSTGIIGGAKERAPDLPPAGYVLGAVVVTVAMWLLAQRSPGSGRLIIGLTVPPAWLAALELSGVPVISTPLNAVAGSLGNVAPAIALLFAGLAAYFIYVRYIKDATTPETVKNVSLNIRGGDKK